MCKQVTDCQLFSPNRVLASISMCPFFRRQETFWKYCRIHFVNNHTFTPYKIFASNKLCWGRVAQSVQRLGCGLDDSELESWQGQGIILFSNLSLLTMGLTNSSILWVPAFIPAVKASGT